MHFWMHVIDGVEGFRDHYYMEDIDKEFLVLAKKIHETYMVIPSDEIWPEDIMMTTLKQIEYYWDADYFKKKDDALEILASLNDLIDHAENMAALSCKLRPGDKTKQQYDESNCGYDGATVSVAPDLPLFPPWTSTIYSGLAPRRPSYRKYEASISQYD